MPFDPNLQIFKSETSTQSWGNIKGQGILTAKSEQRRGVDYALGAEFRKQINELLNKWAQLKILVEAKVSATAQVKIQTPLDLFDEAGFAARLQIVLEAAVAAGLNMNLTMGQLAEILKARPEGKGLSGQLLELLLNETKLEAALFGQYAIGFMAYANFVTVGSLHKNEEFPEPSFQFLYEAGMGFIVGGGYRSYIHMKMPDPRHLVQIFSDLLIDGVVNKVITTQQDQALMLGSMLKIAVKASYEVSDRLSNETNPNKDEIARKVLLIIWDQFQKVVFLQMGLFYRAQVVDLLNRSNLPSDESAALVQKLQAVKANQFPTYSDELFRSLSLLITSIQDEHTKREFVEALSVLWVSSYFIAFPYESSPTDDFHSFTGSLPFQFHPEIKNWINTSLKRDKDANLNVEEILGFLLDRPVASAVQGTENLRHVGRILSPALGNDLHLVIQKLFHPQEVMASIGSFQSILSAISQSFDDYVDREISGRSAAISNTLSDEQEIALLFNRALVPSIQIVSDILLPETVNGFQNFDRKTMLEVLSSPLLTMLGRSVVHIVSTLSSIVNNRIEGILRDGVQNVTNALKPLGVQEIVKKPLEEAAKAIADLVAPLPANVQNELFDRTANLMSPIEGNAVDYAKRLKNDVLYMPQGDEIEEIVNLLLQHLWGKMTDFAGKIIPALFQALIDDLLKKIDDFLKALAARLEKIINDIKKIVADKIAAQLVDPFIDVAKTKAVNTLNFNVLDVIGAGEVKEAFFNALKGAVQKAVGPLLPVVLLPFEELKIAPLKVVEVFKGVTDFSFDHFQRLFTNHLFDEIQKQVGKSLRMKKIGIDLEVPVSFKIDLPDPLPDITKSHTFRLYDLNLPSSTVLDLIMKVIRDNFRLSDDQSYYQLVSAIWQVLKLQEQIVQLQQEKLQAMQKYVG
ncbi:hypothetical protein [Paenibacillus sp. GbtcB18]|uniref:hypothetical protein n=1 Tax=Paenibacillus sp. GbtcB18 TaxID=2824763 RepID=UPI001C3061E5|nr:hypothetical protein [Paenibacillus sp. GbtcB18]